MEIESTDRDLMVQERSTKEFAKVIIDLQRYVRSTPKRRSMVMENAIKI